MSAKLPAITRQQLRQYNGKDGAPAYVACNGVVYDVTGSYQWQKARHQVVHEAGADLTGALAQAPHGEELLWRFPKVATLRED